MSVPSLLGDAVAGVRGLGRYRGGRDRPGPAGVEAVLVHGYGSHPGHLQAWARIAGDAGCSVRHVAYRPWNPYDEIVERVADVLEAAAVRGVPVAVLAHSLGGIIVRDAVSRRDVSVRQVVTVGSPHHGSRWAGWSRGCAGVVEPGSDVLERLAVAWAERDEEIRWVTVGMENDVVVPAAAAVLDGAKQLVLERVGHLGAIEDPRVLAVIDDAVRGCVRT